MTNRIQVQLTEEEAKFILAALDRAPLQGISTAMMVTVIAEKLGKAQLTAKPTPEIPVLSRGTIPEAKPVNGAPIER
jgi:hypothetical protein